MCASEHHNFTSLMDDLPLRGSLKVLKIYLTCQGRQWHVAACIVMVSYTIMYSPFYWSNERFMFMDQRSCCVLSFKYDNLDLMCICLFIVAYA